MAVTNGKSWNDVVSFGWFSNVWTVEGKDFPLLKKEICFLFLLFLFPTTKVTPQESLIDYKESEYKDN